MAEGHRARQGDGQGDCGEVRRDHVVLVLRPTSLGFPVPMGEPVSKLPLLTVSVK
jgi:hypothetical protein